MKRILKSILLTSLILFVVSEKSYGAGVKNDYPPEAGNDALEAACKQAATESKVVFLKSGYPECSWCRVFDRYHSTPEVRQILEKYYVVAAIDTKYMPDGKAVFSRYAQPGAPSWVILTAQKEVIVDSYAEGGNVGYPLRPNETAHYLAALKQATPAITDEELEVLSRQIQKAAGK